jgi:hypothetical protein
MATMSRFERGRRLYVGAPAVEAYLVGEEEERVRCRDSLELLTKTPSGVEAENWESRWIEEV